MVLAPSNVCSLSIDVEGAQSIVEIRIIKAMISFNEMLFLPVLNISKLFDNRCSCDNSCYTICLGYISIDHKAFEEGINVHLDRRKSVN